MQTPVSDTITRIRESRMLYCGLESGMMQLRDPNSLRTEKLVAAHSGPVTDLDCKGDLLISCGLTRY